MAVVWILLLGSMCGLALVGSGCRGQRPPAPGDKAAESADASPSPSPSSPIEVPAGEAVIPSPRSRAASRAASPVRAFSVYALSRAKGVPAEAREALRRVRELVEADRSRGLRVRVETKRVGLEGETRVCAEYDDPEDAGRAFERASALVKGVELVNLVVEPCDKPEDQEEERKP